MPRLTNHPFWISSLCSKITKAGKPTWNKREMQLQFRCSSVSVRRKNAGPDSFIHRDRENKSKLRNVVRPSIRSSPSFDMRDHREDKPKKNPHNGQSKTWELSIKIRSFHFINLSIQSKERKAMPMDVFMHIFTFPIIHPSQIRSLNRPRYRNLTVGIAYRSHENCSRGRRRVVGRCKRGVKTKGNKAVAVWGKTSL